jgi:secreted trypsin-like serine protease
MKILVSAVLFSLFICVTACGGGGAGGVSGSCGAVNKIVNGDVCSGEQRSLALLNISRQSGNSGSCTGIFISATSILTAAHCIIGFTSTGLDEPIEIGITVNDISTSAEGWRVNKYYIVSEALNIFDGAFDIAIVKVDPGFISAAGAAPQPVLLNRFPEKGEKVTIAGFGQTETGELSLNDPRAAEVTFAGTDEINRLITIPSQNEGAVCFGDSGGPLLAKTDDKQMAIVGVTSFGKSVVDQSSCGTGTISYFSPLGNKGNSSFILSEASDAIVF